MKLFVELFKYCLMGTEYIFYLIILAVPVVAAGIALTPLLKDLYELIQKKAKKFREEKKRSK